MKSTNHRRLASRKGGVWKNESLNESFGSHGANKVKTNAYYKNMKVFFELECMSTCCWGLPKPKYEPFITHNRGTLNNVTKKITSRFIYVFPELKLWSSDYMRCDTFQKVVEMHRLTGQWSELDDFSHDWPRSVTGRSVSLLADSEPILLLPAA